MLKIEVIKFEAQDVITASTPVPVEPKCFCSQLDTNSHGVESSTHHYNIQTGEACPVTEHVGCPSGPN